MAKITIGPTCWKDLDVIPTAALGSAAGGGYIICRSGGVGWIVAPSSTEVSRTWHCRDDAVTTAQASAACGDWFIPTIGQLQNPGYTCRAYWDPYFPSGRYWSSTENTSGYAFSMTFTTALSCNTGKGSTHCVRALRCVTY